MSAPITLAHSFTCVELSSSGYPESRNRAEIPMDPMTASSAIPDRRRDAADTLQVLSIVGGIAALSDFGAHSGQPFIVLMVSLVYAFNRLVAEKNL